MKVPMLATAAGPTIRGRACWTWTCRENASRLWLLASEDDLWACGSLKEEGGTVVAHPTRLLSGNNSRSSGRNDIIIVVVILAQVIARTS